MLLSSKILSNIEAKVEAGYNFHEVQTDWTEYTLAVFRESLESDLIVKDEE